MPRPSLDVINNNEDVAAVNKTIRIFIMPSRITIGLFTFLHSSSNSIVWVLGNVAFGNVPKDPNYAIA